MGAGKSLQGLNPSRHHWLLRCDQRKTRFHKPANEGAVCLLVLGWNSITAVYRIGSHMPNVTAHPLWGFLPLHFRFERGTMDEAMYESQHRSHPLHPFPPAIMMLSLSPSLRCRQRKQEEEPTLVSVPHSSGTLSLMCALLQMGPDPRCYEPAILLP